MTSRELLGLLRSKGCVEVRQKGSHVFVECGNCKSTVAMHSGDIAKGTLHQIERALAPCLGDKWLR